MISVNYRVFLQENCLADHETQDKEVEVVNYKICIGNGWD